MSDGFKTAPTLLSLPVELRLTIWLYVLDRLDCIIRHKFNDQNCRWVYNVVFDSICTGQRSHLNMPTLFCLINKAIYSETIDLLYRRAPFSLDVSYRNIHEFRLPLSLRSKIHHICLQPQELKILNIKFPSLPGLIELPQSSLESSRHVVVEGLPNLKSLKVICTEDTCGTYANEAYWGNYSGIAPFSLIELIFFRKRFDLVIEVITHNFRASIRNSGGQIDLDFVKENVSRKDYEFWVHKILGLGDSTNGESYPRSAENLIFRANIHDVARRDDIEKIRYVIAESRMDDFERAWMIFNFKR